MKITSKYSDQTKFEQLVLLRLEQIEQRLNIEKLSTEEKYLQPKEVCQKLGISRNKFEQMRRDGFIRVYKPDPNGRKMYSLLSEIQLLFPKDFQ